MDEYIKKSDALKATRMVYIECIYLDEQEYEEAEADDIPVVFKRDIESIPAADVAEVKHGYWIGEFSKERLSLDEDGRVETEFECAVCFECGEDLLASEEYLVRGRYCPACGAKMDGKREEQNK